MPNVPRRIGIPAGMRRAVSRRKLGQVRSGARERHVVLDWIAGSGSAAATALVLLAGSEAVALLVERLDVPGPRWGLDHRVTPDSFEAFVAALVGSFAVFLALFFTTLGVVATTAYADVPGELRTVFLRERENTVYVNTVVRALVFGTVLLAAHTVGYHPYSVTVLVFAVLSLLSVFGSAALGVGLFNFFDLAKLAAPLPQRFLAAAECAVVSARGVPLSGRHQAAHDDARLALRLLRDVLRLIVKPGGTPAVASAALITTLEMWSGYADLKPAIPTGGAWFSRSRRETNWLTLNPFELEDPLGQTSARVSVAPDLLWAERELVEHYTAVLRPVVQGEDWETAVDAVDPTSGLASRLVAALQVQEALLLCRTASAVIDYAADNRETAARGDSAPDRVQRQRFRAAVVQAGLVVRSQMWQGLSSAAQRAADPGIGDRLEHAAHAPNDPAVSAVVPISPELRGMLDAISAGLAIERDAHGTEISPGWWLRHLTARALTRSLFTTADELLEDLHDYLPKRLGAVAPFDDCEALVTLLLTGLETVRRVEIAVGQVERAAAELATLQQGAASDEPWPTWDPDRPVLAVRRTELLRALGPAAARLPGRPHLGDEPDLLGRAYLVIADALFHAVMDGEDATAAALFPAAMVTAQRAHQRAAVDVGDQPAINHLAHATAPLVDMMLISGYAMFLYAFDGSGIWPTVRTAWDQATATPDLACLLAAILESRHRKIPGDMRRSPWQQRFGGWLGDHGLESGQREFASPRQVLSHESPMVRAVIGQGWMTTYLMADLFLLEYLTARPGGGDLQPGRHTRVLRDALVQARGGGQEEERRG